MKDSAGSTGRTAGSALTPFTSLDATLAEHAKQLREALQDNFIGMYLLGSLAIGDFDLTSDVDLVVVTREELDERQRGLAQSCHTGIRSKGNRWVSRLEYSFCSMAMLDELSSPYGEGGTRNDTPGRQLWYFGHGSPTLERSDHDNTLVTRWTLVRRSPAVLGPAPHTFAPDVGPDALRTEIRNSMLGWGALVPEDTSLRNRFHQVFLVLNNCRALQDLHEGRITSKLEGVRWARQHLDPRWHPLVEFCWRERQDSGIHISQPADPDAWRQTLAFVEHTTRLAEQVQL